MLPADSEVSWTRAASPDYGARAPLSYVRVRRAAPRQRRKAEATTHHAAPPPEPPPAWAAAPTSEPPSARRFRRARNPAPAHSARRALAARTGGPCLQRRTARRPGSGTPARRGLRLTPSGVQPGLPPHRSYAPTSAAPPRGCRFKSSSGDPRASPSPMSVSRRGKTCSGLPGELRPRSPSAPRVVKPSTPVTIPSRCERPPPASP